MQNMKKRILMITIACLMSMTACGSWVDMPGQRCNEQFIKRIKKHSSSSNRALIATCKRAGKEYGGDVRCSDGKLQVKCK